MQKSTIVLVQASCIALLSRLQQPGCLGPTADQLVVDDPDDFERETDEKGEQQEKSYIKLRLNGVGLMNR